MAISKENFIGLEVDEVIIRKRGPNTADGSHQYWVECSCERACSLIKKIDLLNPKSKKKICCKICGYEKLDFLQIREICETYQLQKESTCKSLGLKFNVTPTTIHRTLIRNGIRLRPTGQRNKIKVGDEYGLLTVKKKAKGGKHSQWWCECSCGRACILIYTTNLRNRNNLSDDALPNCGCLNSINERGKTYGRLYVVKPSGYGDGRWWCECSCGFQCKLVSGAKLRNGNTKSCGELCPDATEEDYKRRVANHLEKIKKHGRVQLIGEYKGDEIKTDYLCLKHNRIYPARPNDVGSGKGLRCCFEAGLRKELDKRKRLAELEYLRLIDGKFILVEPYINNRVAIKHYCIRHEKTYPSVPDIHKRKRGSGLECCKQEKDLNNAKARMDKSASTYDEDIKKFGKAKRIGVYKGAHIKIKHQCLRHGEEHDAYPTQIRKGHGLNCCMHTGYDSIEQAINGTLRDGDKAEWLYIYHLKNFNGFLKLGIARNFSDVPYEKDPIKRPSDPEYGEQECLWPFDNRLDAFLVEEALLKITLNYQKYPSELYKWAGYTEIRKCNPDFLTETAQLLIDEFNDLGRWQFAANYVPMSIEQKQECERRAKSEIIR